MLLKVLWFVFLHFILFAPKFKRKSLGFVSGESDNSRFAQWLRVFDGLNNERPVPVPEGSQFALLQKKAELSKFTEDFLVSEAMLMDNEPIEKIVKYSGLSEKDTLELRRLQTDTSRK